MIKFILSKTVTLISLILVLSISGCSYWGSAPTLEWAFGIGGPEADWGKDIVSDKDGNIIILGHVEGGVDLDPGPNEKYLNSGRREDDFLASYSSTGQLNWAFTLPSGSSLSTSMMTDELGNLLVLSSFGRGETDFDPGPATFNLIGKARRSLYVASYSSTGGLNWAFDIGESDEETDGTLSANDFALDSNGNIIITGGYTRTIDLDSGPESYLLHETEEFSDFVASFSPDGTLNWAFNIEPSDQISIDHVAVDSQDNVIINGDLIGAADFDPSDAEHILATSNRDSGVFVASYTSQGTLNWAFNLTSNTENSGDQFSNILFERDMAIDHSDNILVMGSFNHSVDFDPSQETAIITARISELGFPSRNTFIASYSPAGSLNWVRGFDTTRIDGNALVIDSANNFVIVGDFSNSVDFDLDSGTANLNATDRLDVFAASYRSTNGAFNWVIQVISRSNDLGYGIALDEMDNVFITGEFNDSADFDPNYWMTEITSNGEGDLFLAKYACCPE